ncbi:MAG: leucine-rich repeat domain-containing protein [Armatimonadetes bacterium]|nr:leucine-rich repeat domain-containing protein [Armatimonadota bacterium]
MAKWHLRLEASAAIKKALANRGAKTDFEIEVGMDDTAIREALGGKAKPESTIQKILDAAVEFKYLSPVDNGLLLEAYATRAASAGENKGLLAHLERVKEATKLVDLLGNSLTDQQIHLPDVLIELTAEEKKKRKERFGADQDPGGISEEPETKKLSFADYQRLPFLVLLGDAGSGKTTTLRHMAYQAAEACEQDPSRPVPFYSTVREFRESKSADTLLQHFEATSQGLFSKAMQEGRAAVFLDSLDEVPGDKDSVIEQISKFSCELQAKTGNRLVVSTRPGVLEGATFGAPLDAKVHFKLAPLDEAQRDGLIVNYALHLAKEEKFEGIALADRQQEIATRTRKALRDHEGLQELSTNPLLLTMAVFLFAGPGNVQVRNRAEFYEAAFDKILAQGKEQVDDGFVGLFQDLMPAFAYASLVGEHLESGYVPKQAALRGFWERDCNCNKSEASRFLEKLLKRQTFVESTDGDRIAFRHRTFAEFLVARYIVENEGLQPGLISAAELFRERRSDPNWVEVIKLAVGLRSLVDIDDAESWIRDGIWNDEDRERPLDVFVDPIWELNLALMAWNEMPAGNRRANWDGLYGELLRSATWSRWCPVDGVALNDIGGLSVARYAVRELAPLRECKNLEVLDLNGTPVTSIEALSECKNLKSLYLDGTPVISIEALSKCENLEVLQLRDTPVTSIEALSKCENLKSLYLDGTPVISIEALSKCENLEVLELRDTPVTSIEALSKCENLEVLQLRDTPVTSIEALSECKNLEVLDLNGTPVTSIEALSECKNLRSLGLNGTRVPVKQISWLEALIWPCYIVWSPPTGAPPAPEFDEDEIEGN